MFIFTPTLNKDTNTNTKNVYDKKNLWFLLTG